MISRQIGKFLFGRTTPFQIFAACLLGAWLGFLPGVTQAPGLVLVLLGLLAVLNAPLGLAASMTIIAKLLSLALLPLSHAIGTFLLEGPIEGLFRVFINAPYFAWCGFEYHSVTGGSVVGGGFGLAIAVLLTRAVSRLRTAFLELDENSEKFNEFMARRWVRITSWLLLGGSPKRENLELLAGKKVGLPVRPLGAALVVGVGVLLVVLPGFFAEPVLTGALRGGLERANGATVDLESAAIDLGDGRFTLSGLAMADRYDLEQDLLRATTVTADLDLSALLSRRWKIEELIVEQAASGEERARPATVITKDEPAAPTPPQEPTDEEGTTIVTLDDILEDVKEWEAKLEKAKKILGWVVGDGEPGERASDEHVSPRWSRATHLIEEAPTVLLDRLSVAQLKALQFGETLLAVEGWNLSTDPDLVPDPAGFSLTSTDGRFRLAVNESETDRTPTPERVAFRQSGISGDKVGEKVRYHGTPLLAGGTIDVSFAGRWWREEGLQLDLPLQVTLNGCRVRIPGSDRLESIEKLVIPIHISGKLTAPRFRFDSQDLIDGLIDSGRRELANRARSAFDEKLGAETDRLKEKLTEKLDGEIGDALGDALGDEVKKSVEKLGGGLLDRFQPKKDDDKD